MWNPLPWLQRLSLRLQVALGVTLIFLLLFGLFGYLANHTIQRSTELTKQERLKVAETTASSIDSLVRHVVHQLSNALRIVSPVEETAQDYMVRLARHLELSFHAMGTYNELVLTDPEGKVFWSYPQPWAGEGLNLLPIVEEALRVKQTVVGQAELPPEARHPPVAIVAVPVLHPEGEYVLVGILHLTHMGVNLTPLPPGSPTFVTQVINNQGRVLASSIEEAQMQKVDPHLTLLEPLIRSRQSGVKLHQAGGSGHLVAFAPLTMLDGGVVVEEREDLALAVPQGLRRTFFIFGFLSLLAVSLAALGHAHYVTRPLASLQKATERIAAGELNGPFTISRQDEVGKLAKSFEAMRVQLEAASRERVQFENQLENRVRERTQEAHRLLGKIITAQEEERKRLARELHDETAQALATLLVSIEALSSSLPAEQTRAKELFNQALSQGKAALADLRRTVLNLRPSALDDLGFTTALHSYAQERLTAAGIRLSFETVGAEQRLPGPVETALFRILQEAVNNIARHSQAKKALLRLEFSPDHFSALAEDDGVGFDSASLSSEAGVGLQGMKERAELIGAHLEIASSPGAGTKIRVELALKEKDE